MKVVVDTDRIIVALIREGTNREILFDEAFEFITPDYTIIEILEHSDELKIKTKLNNEEFEILLNIILENIKIIPKYEYENFIEECKHDISDPDDISILALAISTNADYIWSHDSHFKEQNKVKVFTNIDMLRIRGKTSD